MRLRTEHGLVVVLAVKGDENVADLLQEREGNGGIVQKTSILSLRRYLAPDNQLLRRIKLVLFKKIPDLRRLTDEKGPFDDSFLSTFADNVRARALAKE